MPGPTRAALLALSFAKRAPGGTPSQYYYNFNNTANTYISPTSVANWGVRLLVQLQFASCGGRGSWQPSEETMVCFGGCGGWFQPNTAVEVELYNQGTTLGGNPVGMLYVSDWSGDAWTSSAAGTPATGAGNHVAHADENGTGYLWMNDTLVGTNASSGQVGTSSGGMPAPDLSTVADNVLIGCRNYGGTIAEGFDGAIDQVRLFTFAPGTFNVTETDPSTTPTYHPGDANGDGRVDINDLTIVLANFGQTGMTWSQGEFTGDGTVDINDLTIVLANYGWTGKYLGPIDSVPEPAGLVLVCAAGSLWPPFSGAAKRCVGDA